MRIGLTSIFVDVATGDKTVIARLEPGLDSLAFDSHDRLFVSSFQDGFIAEVERDGQVRIGSRASTAWRSAGRARSMSAATRPICCTASTEELVALFRRNG